VTVPPFHWWRTVFVLIPFIGVYTIVLGVLSLASSLVSRRGAFAHRCAQWWAKLILVTSGVRVVRRGAALPPGQASCVFVANHASTYDIPILFAAIPRQLRIIAKAALGRFPFIGWHLQRSGHLLVDRRHPGASVLKKMARMTHQGASLIVFPEGSRSPDGRLLAFKGGVFLLAIESGLPVVPVSVAGSRVVMPKGRLMVCPAVVDVTVHDAIPTAGLTRGDARELADRVRAIIAADLPGWSPGPSGRSPGPSGRSPGPSGPGMHA
jgi:1-acyl-sn-glycerol-3-phosphate acyltransferase